MPLRGSAGCSTIPKLKCVCNYGYGLHKARTVCEDNSVVIVEFENGVTCVAENSWAKHGGMDDRCEVYGTGGVVYADLFMGNAAVAYSKNGYGYAMEKADTTVGWKFYHF